MNVRQVLAIVTAVFVLAGAVGGAYWWLDQQAMDEDTDLAGADATADAYLDAWAAGDHAAMRDLVRDPPETFVDDLVQLRDGLGIDALTVERTDLVEDVDGRAEATATVTVEPPAVTSCTGCVNDDVGEVSWQVALTLLRERGRWGIAWDPASLHPDWQPGLSFGVTRDPVDRAPILARDGTVLAGPGERVTFGFDPGTVEDVDEVVAAFEEGVPGSGATAERLLGQGGLVDGWFYPVVSVPVDEAREARSALSGIAGVLRRSDDASRSLLAEDFAVHVVGRVAEATREQLDQLGAPYEVGDEVGQFGLEAALEPRLATGERVTVGLFDGSDDLVGEPFATARVGGPGTTSGGDGAPSDGDDAPSDGDDATEAQPGPVTTTLDVTVQRAVENTLLGREDETAIVVVDGADGAIRAAASRPIDGFDRALQGRYPPGEAFALVTAEAALAEEDRPGDAVDAEALTAAAERLGFGVEPTLPLPASGGSFPDPGVELAGATAGQARVETSPLHLASVAAAVVSGTWHAPYLLEGGGPGESRPLAPGTLDGLRTLLEDATPETVATGGVAGIAGTAQGVDATHVWFVGTVAADPAAADADRSLGIAILVEDGGDDPDADQIAGGLVDRFARELAALRDVPADLEGSSVP